VSTVIVKHQGKKHEVEVDTTSNGETFKYQLFSITGVEPERQKIIVKGGQLKDDADMSKLGLKSGQTLMMMGTPSGDNTNVIEKPKVFGGYGRGRGSSAGRRHTSWSAELGQHMLHELDTSGAEVCP
jgi:hypothetical protein